MKGHLLTLQVTPPKDPLQELQTWFLFTCAHCGNKQQTAHLLRHLKMPPIVCPCGQQIPAEEVRICFELALRGAKAELARKVARQ